MKKANYFLLLNLHEKVKKECITGSLPASVCKGAKEGEKRNGYAIGAQDREFDIASSDKYITRISEYVKSNTSLNYEETAIATNRASVVYTNKNTQNFLVFNLYQSENNWKIKDVVLGINHKSYLKSFYPPLE